MNTVDVPADFFHRLWWLTQDLDNTADAIGPVPHLAEENLRHHATAIRELAEPYAKQFRQNA